jgi:hypothetical protein
MYKMHPFHGSHHYHNWLSIVHMYVLNVSLTWSVVKKIVVKEVSYNSVFITLPD